jgi:putative addiction module component (TIGR02574 family)
MQTEKLRIEIDKLDLSEKLTLVEEVWNDIAKSSHNLPLPEWQKTELNKRLSAYDQGKVKTKDHHQVHEALRMKYE